MRNFPEKSEKGILSGVCDLSPIQIWFFEQNLPNRNYFNQAEIFEGSRRISLSILKSVFKVISQYHDVFRMRYRFADGTWVQEYLESEVVTVEEKILQSRNYTDLRKEIEQHSEIVQSSLNLTDGPLAKVVLYRCFDEIDRIFICSHHLIIDGISWRVLLEDIETLYSLFLKHQRILLPAKCFSFRQWVNAVRRYSKSEEIKREIVYWNTVVENQVDLYREHLIGEKAGTDVVTLRFSKSETDGLIYNVPKIYESRINEILLTALVLAVGDVTSEYRCSISLEGHGREEIVGIDVSRTVGWFTSIFPVNLSITNREDISNSIVEIRNIINDIPNNGISYGIINYYVNRFSKNLPRLGFNYLGQFSNPKDENSFLSYSDYSVGRCEDKHNLEYNLIDINALVRLSKLEVNFGYRTDYFTKEEIVKFSELFKEELLRIIYSKK